jgi:hypothetical protein
MALYRTNIASLNVPDTWKDQSISAFRLPAPPGGGADASFVVTRDDTKGVKAFETYVAEQVEACRRSLPDFTLLKSDPVSVQGLAAAWIEFTWSKDGADLFLRQVYFDCGFFVTICTLTTTPRDLPYFDPAWHGVMASLTFDRPEAIPAFQPQGR